MEQTITNIVNNCQVVDLHTHLFPCEHTEQ